MTRWDVGGQLYVIAFSAPEHKTTVVDYKHSHTGGRSVCVPILYVRAMYSGVC